MHCCHAYSSRQLTCELIKALPSLERFDLLKYEDINQVLTDVVHKGMLQGRVGKVVLLTASSLFCISPNLIIVHLVSTINSFRLLSVLTF